MKFPNLNLIKQIHNLYNNKYSSNSHKDKKYKIAIELSNIGLWEWNINTNKVFYSKESIQIIGYSESDIKNTSKFWDDKVHADDKDEYFKDFNRFLEGYIDFYENEYRIRCKDGSYKWILDKAKVVEKDKNNKSTCIIGTHTDITSSKVSEELLEKNLQLITCQNKRLYSFTHIVSHNLKTHIGNFKNILEFYDEAESENEKEELIGHLQTISKSLTTTIVDLDDIVSIKSKSDSQDLNEHINLYDFTNKIIESLKIDIENKEITVHNAIKKGDTLFTNKPYLESIFYNLISNGIKYSDPKKDSQIIIEAIHINNTIKILISDNGIGIDMDKYKNHIFEMYKTFHGTKRADSRGVGLYITKTQVEAIHGEIQVESTLNHGTSFSITLKK
ncbi:PAS domain-containing sensor histidine kinase [Winogradskyella undariae]|uniref:sensor histidine kinase n=1 Tax=Winogradskyella undariae TaxID=1285465 RepID=UPI00156B555E|nr:PAS domain-containing sensor histidine kinase [Winogradskyella undariae]NRR92532.1 PAS domain-containing sensor histidine kinase [Winogradskyella undariae]